VSIAFAQDLRACCFSTKIATRKYRLLTECDRVALVIDDRDRFPGEIMRTSALTATGRARRVEAGTEFDTWASLLVSRHPYLGSFIAPPSTALFIADVARYVYVTRFQEVHEWVPA
jgi:hypothetical protein